MKKKLLALLLTVSAVGLAACGGNTTSQNGASSNSTASNKPVIVKTTTFGELASLNILTSSDTPTLVVLSNSFEGLYRPAADGGNELGIAAEEPEVSEDGKTYTFTIREDANWSNGDPVVAEDFVYSYRAAVTPATMSPNVNKFFPILNAKEISEGTKEPSELGIKAIDDKTLEFTLNNPTSYFKGLLGTPAYLPQNAKFAQEKGSDYGSSSDNAVYNGPFIVQGWSGTEISWKTVKNPEYWDSDNVKIDEVEWQMSKENSTNVNLFEAGDIDITAITNPYVEQWKDREELQTDPKGMIGYLQFNFTRDTTNNVHVRRALISSFDKEAYVNTVLADGSKPVDGWVPAEFDKNPETGKDFRAENGSLNPFDLELAQAEWELAKADLGVETLSLELLTSDTDTSKTTSEFLQAEWQKNLPGLTITIKNVPLKSRQQIATEKEYDMVYGTYNPSYVDPTAFLEYFESTSLLNNAYYHSEAYDGLLEDARSTYANDPKQRWQTLLQAEKQLITEDAAVGSIYQGAFANLVNPKLKGVVNQSNGTSLYFRAATLED